MLIAAAAVASPPSQNNVRQVPPTPRRYSSACAPADCTHKSEDLSRETNAQGRESFAVSKFQFLLMNGARPVRPTRTTSASSRSRLSVFVSLLHVAGFTCSFRTFSCQTLYGGWQLNLFTHAPLTAMSNSSPLYISTAGSQGL